MYDRGNRDENESQTETATSTRSILKHFNSNKVANYIINKSFDINKKQKFYWENK